MIALKRKTRKKTKKQKKLERKQEQQQQLDDFRLTFLENGKRKASAKRNFVVGSFSCRERSIRGKEDKKNEENRGRERAKERDGGQLPRNRHQFDFVMLRILAKQERNGCSVSNKMKTNNNNNNRNYNHKLKRYKQ